MNDDAVYVCGQIGAKLSDDPVEDLKMLKAVLLITQKFDVVANERFFAVKMEKSIFTKEKFPRLIRRKLKKTEYRRVKPPRKVRKQLRKCRILADSSDRVFFLASPESLGELLSCKRMKLENMSIDEVLELLWSGASDSGHVK